MGAGPGAGGGEGLPVWGLQESAGWRHSRAIAQASAAWSLSFTPAGAWSLPWLGSEAGTVESAPGLGTWT